MQRPSYEKGIKEGVNTGISKTISILIAKKFGSQVRRELPRLRHLSTNDLMELAENIFSFNSLNSVHDWIKQKKLAARD